MARRITVPAPSSVLTTTVVLTLFTVFLFFHGFDGVVVVVVESFQTPSSLSSPPVASSVHNTIRRSGSHFGGGCSSISSNNNNRYRNNAILNNNNNNNAGPRCLFSRNDDDDDGSTTTSTSAEKAEEQQVIGGSDDAADDEVDEKKLRSFLPFFGRFMAGKSRSNDSQNEAAAAAAAASSQDGSSSTSGTTTTATIETNTGSAVATLEKPPVAVVKHREEETPETLRAKAERARLEAERMDAELTLMKIEKLTKQLSKAQKTSKTTGAGAGERGGVDIDDLQRQIDDLQAKLRGEPPKPRQPAPVASTTTAAASTSSSSSPSSSVAAAEQQSSSSSPSEATTSDGDSGTNKGVIDLLRNDVLKKRTNLFRGTQRELVNAPEDYDADFLKMLPDFIIKIWAAVVEMGVPDDGTVKIDFDELARRINLVRKGDYSFSTTPEPNFTQQQIDETVEKIKTTEGKDIKDMFGDVGRARKMAGGNETQLALNYLTTEYYLDKAAEKAVENTDDVDKFFPKVIKDLVVDLEDLDSIDFNISSIDIVIDKFYPKCTRKEGEEPTEAQADALMRTVLPSVKFSCSSKPQKVSGGYLLRGSHRYENGDDLIKAIDGELSKNAALDGTMTVLYAPDCTPPEFDIEKLTFDEMVEMSMEMDEAEKDPILYVTGPDITRDSNRLGLTVASILGIATSWYLSIYPFLLNDKIAQRVDEELALIDTGMQPDLSWLTDLSIPLFTTFLCLQAVHELAHRIVAATKGVKMSVPVFVPSLITGVTSTATTFKSLPKNREDMFDISASGPLFGIVASSIALAVGTKLTLVSDPSMLPALPLDILRQSTLGGGIIEQIIPGSLYVPEGAPTNGITISLHPIAIAGYISLIVNALSLLPIGTTDGGRLTMALFGREAKLGVGSNTLFLLLIYGLFGSDLFLFYFSYLLAFETGNEVPARNEVDEPDISRGVVALICYGLAILSLVPFQ